MARQTATRGQQPGVQQTLADALKEVEQQQRRSRKTRRKKRNNTDPGIAARVRIALIVVGVPLLLLTLDGLRREADEFHPRVDSVTGQVQRVRDGGAVTTARAGETLDVGDHLVTGPRSQAVVVLADGSAVQIEPTTRFEIRDLDYARDGRRSRMFLVRFGSVVARFGKLFGVGSRGSVTTPGAVAAVRGTAFRVAYSAQTQQTLVGVAEGTVSVRSQGLSGPCRVGQMALVNGYQLVGLRPLAPADRAALNRVMQRLAVLERPPGFLVDFERGLLRTLDPVLRVVGMAPGGFSVTALDFARRTATTGALRDLAKYLEGADDAPNTLSLTELTELQIPAQVRARLLRTFAGGMLESYRKPARNQYVVRARARDPEGTLFELTPNGIREVPEAGQ